MSDGTPAPRRKWAEIQAEIFVGTARELGCAGADRRFESLLRKLLPEITPERLREETFELESVLQRYRRRDSA